MANDWLATELCISVTVTEETYQLLMAAAPPHDWRDTRVLGRVIDDLAQDLKTIPEVAMLAKEGE